MFENDPGVPTEKLLSQIKSACVQNTSKNIDQMSLIMPPVSALLVKLSDEASKTADKNIKIQNKMIVLTSIILAISIAQLFLAFSMFSNPVPHKATINTPSAVATPQTINTKSHKTPENSINKQIMHNEVPTK